MAAISNAVVQIANTAMPSFGHKSSDNTQSNSKVEDLVYDQDKQKTETTTSTNIASNINSTGNLNITSQNNTLIKGSNLSANNIALTTTTGTTTITSAQDQVSRSIESINQSYNNTSAEYNRGRASLDSNSKVEEITTTTNTITQKQSTLTAANNIIITSNQDLNILSSNLTATAGATTLTSQEGNVNILALQNTTTTSSETKTGTLTLSAGVGNSAIDTAYAEYDLYQAAKALADAKNNLNHMETLKRNGQASQDAVDDARINLQIANLNLMLAELKLAASAAKTASNAKSLGFYGDIRLEIAGSKTTSNSSTATNIASNITSATNLTITSGLNLANNNTTLQLGTIGNTTVTGSNITSTTGDITITSKNTTTLNASKDTYNESTKTKAWSESLTLASTTAGGAQIDQAINALQISLGLSMSKSKSDTNSTTYNNTTLTAENGNIKINSLATSFDANSTDANKNNAGTDISGANILANNITINTQGNLTVESLQNQYTQKSKSFGLNLGIGGGAGGGSVKASGNASVGINYSTTNTDRLWTDNQTSIIGTNSVTINTKNNTTLTGAVIANILNADDLYASTGKAIGANAIDGNNLTLNTKTLTIANLEDHLYTESQGAGISSSIGWGGGNAKGSANNSNTGAPNTSQGQGTAAANNPNQQNNFYPNGSTTLSLNHGASSKEQTTFATIGQGAITTNTTLTFDAEGNLLTNTGGVINDANTIANINRDVTKSQVVTKDEITGALNASVTIDNRLLTTDGRSAIANEVVNAPRNILTSTVQLTELTAQIPASPIWVSQVIDANNNEIKDGKFTDHPAPNLWMGNSFDPLDEPSVGRNDEGCRNNAICRETISDEAYHLRALHYGVPGFKSASQFHDAGTTNADGTEKSGTYKFLSIIPYFVVNYYGAVGTIIDAKNWNQNSVPQNNNVNQNSKP